jgi:5-formyltetrahydrofolate cyclo-ligase
VPDDSIAHAKQAIRERVWELLGREHVTEPGAGGYIPAFTGAEIAAALLASTPEWQSARVIKAVPDRAQQPVRERALRDGKLLYMAVPRLAEDPPFYELDPGSLPVTAAEAASRETASKVGRRMGTGQMRPVDMVVCGSVAVNRDGARLGKGAGYSDLEVTLLAEAGLIAPAAVIATTVHPLQVLDELIPEASHDFSVDLIVTTSDAIRCGPPRRPTDIDWDRMPASMIAAIPVLGARRRIQDDDRPRRRGDLDR